MRLLILTMFSASVYAQDLWIGLTSMEIDNNGKSTEQYMAGQISEDDFVDLKKGSNPEKFIQLTNAMYIDTEQGQYEMNSDDKDSKEETDVILFKVKLIARIVMLKDDPRKIYAPKAHDKIEPKKFEHGF